MKQVVVCSWDLGVLATPKQKFQNLSRAIRLREAAYWSATKAEDALNRLVWTDWDDDDWSQCRADIDAAWERFNEYDRVIRSYSNKLIDLAWDAWDWVH